MNKSNLMNRLKGFPLSIEQKQELLNIIEENSGGGAKEEIVIDISNAMFVDGINYLLINGIKYPVSFSYNNDDTNNRIFLTYSSNDVYNYLNSIFFDKTIKIKMSTTIMNSIAKGIVEDNVYQILTYTEYLTLIRFKLN